MLAGPLHPLSPQLWAVLITSDIKKKGVKSSFMSPPLGGSAKPHTKMPPFLNLLHWGEDPCSLHFMQLGLWILWATLERGVKVKSTCVPSPGTSILWGWNPGIHGILSLCPFLLP
jgi:hypothetical protein